MAAQSTGRGVHTPIEIALRHLGGQRYGSLVELIESAIKYPDGGTGAILAPLIEPSSVMKESWSTEARAHAVWDLIREGILAPEVAPTTKSRRRRTLQAAFRIPDNDIEGEWAGSLHQRWIQLKGLTDIFGHPTNVQPMEQAWKRGVGRLAQYLDRRFGELKSVDDWQPYGPGGGHWPVISVLTPSERNERLAKALSTEYRPTKDGAQKLFVDLFVATVVMEGRAVARRISERIITSLEPDPTKPLEFYMARTFTSGSTAGKHSYVQTQALWGCSTEAVDDNGIPTTLLRFPQPLGLGDQAHFMTEAVYEREDDDRGWANVEVDHYGIAPGVVDGLLPVRGLTIRIKFDKAFLPEAVWWYAEQIERERYAVPPKDSPHRLTVHDGEVMKTFEQPCQPRENYGLGYRWITSDGE